MQKILLAGRSRGLEMPPWQEIRRLAAERWNAEKAAEKTVVLRVAA